MHFVAILLTLCTWLGIGILIYFLFAIARFYERKSGRRSYYQAFLATMVLFGLGLIRYLLITPSIIGDIWGDGLRFAGGLILVGFGIFLLRLMMGGSQHK